MGEEREKEEEEVEEGEEEGKRRRRKRGRGGERRTHLEFVQVYNIASNSPDSFTYTKMTGKLHTKPLKMALAVYTY